MACALAVGTVGGMVLGMMTRVALGHTGRPLQTSAITRAAYVALAMAVLLRTLGPAAAPFASYQISGVLWMVSFALFLWHYVPILVGPRADASP